MSAVVLPFVKVDAVEQHINVDSPSQDQSYSYSTTTVWWHGWCLTTGLTPLTSYTYIFWHYIDNVVIDQGTRQKDTDDAGSLAIHEDDTEILVWINAYNIGAHNTTFRLLVYDTPNHESSDTHDWVCLLYTSPSPRDRQRSRMPSSA